MRIAMESDCEHWLEKELDADQRIEVANAIVPLLQGQLPWTFAKGAYDKGLVARLSSSLFVEPVSRVAASVLHQKLSAVLRKSPQRQLSSLSGSEHGQALERQFRALLDPCVKTIRTRQLNPSGSTGPAINVRVDFSLPFQKLSETASSTSRSIMYFPQSPTFRCDAVLVPAPRPKDDDAGASILDPLLLWELSVTDPREASRVNKILKWFFAEDKFIEEVKAAHPNRAITILLCWPGKIDESNHSKILELEEAAKKADVKVYFVDAEGLLALGMVA
jgi:hypothetical protein